MPKLLPMFVWTLGIASLAFAAGRWTASVNEPSGSGDADLAVTTIPDQVQPSPGVENAPVVIESSSKLQVGGLRGYAADYQQLQLLVALAASNPQLAMEKALQFKGAIRAKAQAAILDIWAANDPSAAWNWVEAVQPENSQQFIKLLEVIGAHEPRMAVSYAEKFVAAHRELRKDSYLSLLQGVTQAGAYNFAIDVLSRLEIEPETKAELTTMVVSAWAAYEPEAAMQWVMAQPEALRAVAMEPLAESWSDTDPPAAVNFAAGLSGSMRESLLLPAFRKWLGTDAAAASSWLAAAQINKDFDPIISELATQPTNNNGQVKAALAWAGKIHDPDVRMGTTVSILSAFKQKDPSAAAAYLHELSYLSDQERTQLSEDLAFEQ
jgi:hypothetical protein